MRSSDWSSDVCSSDLHGRHERISHFLGVPLDVYAGENRQAQTHRRSGDLRTVALDYPMVFERFHPARTGRRRKADMLCQGDIWRSGIILQRHEYTRINRRSEEHTSELQSLMRISYAVFCLKKKKK